MWFQFMLWIKAYIPNHAIDREFFKSLNHSIHLLTCAVKVKAEKCQFCQETMLDLKKKKEKLAQLDSLHIYF